MIDKFLNDLKVKRFMSVSKNTDFDFIYKMEDEGLIENKSKNKYRLTKEGIEAANMGYDKYIQSSLLENHSTTKAPTEKPKHIKAIISNGWWKIVIPIIVGIIILIIQNRWFDN